MTQPPIRFNDGAAYERGMGGWSRLVGQPFLDWLAPPTGQRWIDVGCGSGNCTELLIQRCTPSEAQGIDPSAAQLAFARTRPGAAAATFVQGDAMALPFDPDRFDVAVMALVIFFVPDPARGVAEMARVVRPGGLVAAYVWDALGGGSPFHPVQAEVVAMGKSAASPPRADVASIPALQRIWAAAGLQDIETIEFTPTRSFADFEDFWGTSTTTGGVGPAIAAMTAAEVETLRAKVRQRLSPGPDGRITYGARAFAIKGRVPPAS